MSGLFDKKKKQFKVSQKNQKFQPNVSKKKKKGKGSEKPPQKSENSLNLGDSATMFL